jgi:ssDNA-binding Zn-finger/Zn-ribbon topoisomerase 1
MNEFRADGIIPARSQSLAGVLYRPDYNEATTGDCPTTTPAIVVEGKRAGTKLYVCTNPKCKTHYARSVGLSPEEKAERKKQAQEQRIQQEYRRRLLTSACPASLGVKSFT